MISNSEVCITHGNGTIEIHSYKTLVSHRTRTQQIELGNNRCLMQHLDDSDFVGHIKSIIVGSQLHVSLLLPIRPAQTR
uniref:Uncharacterized protein n=1 Tax=Zea mays TaxID=4577 RepID=C4J201_MAIZE|nr:unknown [Zea mays]